MKILLNKKQVFLKGKPLGWLASLGLTWVPFQAVDWPWASETWRRWLSHVVLICVWWDCFPVWEIYERCMMYHDVARCITMYHDVSYLALDFSLAEFVQPRLLITSYEYNGSRWGIHEIMGSRQNMWFPFKFWLIIHVMIHIIGGVKMITPEKMHGLIQKIPLVSKFLGAPMTWVLPVSIGRFTTVWFPRVNPHFWQSLQVVILDGSSLILYGWGSPNFGCWSPYFGWSSPNVCCLRC